MEDGKETKHTAKTDIAIHPTPNISFNILEGNAIYVFEYYLRE